MTGARNAFDEIAVNAGANAKCEEVGVVEVLMNQSERAAFLSDVTIGDDDDGTGDKRAARQPNGGAQRASSSVPPPPSSGSISGEARATFSGIGGQRCWRKDA